MAIVRRFLGDLILSRSSAWFSVPGTFWRAGTGETLSLVSSFPGTTDGEGGEEVLSWRGEEGAEVFPGKSWDELSFDLPLDLFLALVLEGDTVLRSTGSAEEEEDAEGMGGVDMSESNERGGEGEEAEGTRASSAGGAEEEEEEEGTEQVGSSSRSIGISGGPRVRSFLEAVSSLPSVLDLCLRGAEVEEELLTTTVVTTSPSSPGS